MSLKVWAVGLRRHETEEADQTLRRSTVTAHQCQPLLWRPPSLPHCHSLNVQTCMPVNTHTQLHADNKNMHGHTLSEQFFMEIDYVGQPPSLCTAVTLTHGNTGDSFPHKVGSGFILGPGADQLTAYTCSGWRSLACVYVFNIFLTLSSQLKLWLQLITLNVQFCRNRQHGLSFLSARLLLVCTTNVLHSFNS